MADTVEAQGPPQAKTEQLQEKAQEAMGETRSRLRDQLNQRSTQAGEQISSSGSDLRSVGEELRKQGKDAPARYADQAAARVERVGGYLAESDADRILHDVEDFGRRQPLALLAGGMVLGFAAARFLKASSSRRYQTLTAQTNGTGPQVRPALPDPGEHHQRFEGHS